MKFVVRKNAPLRVKIFGCSTGQEPISYALTLLDLGISNFRIYATDIDRSVISEAKTMRYHLDKFLTLPTERQKQLLETYFMPVGDGYYEIRYRNFLEERIRYGVQDISLPLVPTGDPAFDGPYDIVSVKNVLLYLDHSTVLKTVSMLETVTAPGGLMVIRDKRYRVSRFLDKQLKDSMGITDFIALKMPLDTTDKTISELIMLFRDPIPPDLLKYIDQFALERGYDRIHRLILKRLQTEETELDFGLLEVLFKDAMKREDSFDAVELLQRMCRLEPIAFCPNYVRFFKSYPEHAFCQDTALISILRLYQDLGMLGLEKQVEKKLNDMILKYTTGGKGSLELYLVFAHVLSAIDQGRFSKIKRSDDGKWLLRATEMLQNIERDFDRKVVQAHRARILDHYISLYGHKINSKTRQNLIEANRDLLTAHNFSRLAKVAYLKLAVFFSQIDSFPLDERVRVIHQVVEASHINTESLRYLSDRQYSEYFMVLGRAYEFLANNDPELVSSQKLNYILKALDAAETVLGVRSVYANRALDFKRLFFATLNSNQIQRKQFIRR